MCAGRLFQGTFPQQSGEKSRPSHRPGCPAGLIVSSFFLTRGLRSPIAKGSSGAALPSTTATGWITSCPHSGKAPVYPAQQHSFLMSLSLKC